MIGIYKITSPSNKVYIGQSFDIDRRIYRYRRLECKGQTIIYRSLLKYGFHNHKFEIICELPKDISNSILNKYEEFYISQYTECGFNMMNLKGGGLNGLYSEDSKKKMSISQRNKKPISEETRKKLSDNSSRYWKGKSIPECIKENMRVPKVNKTTYECPFCLLIGVGPNMIRYHFKNCKKLK